MSLRRQEAGEEFSLPKKKIRNKSAFLGSSYSPPWRG